MSTNQSYNDISTSRSRSTRRVVAYENDDEQESEGSGMEVAEQDFESGQLYSKEQSSVSSVDETYLSRSDSHKNTESMSMPLDYSSLVEMSADQKVLFNKLEKRPRVNAAMGYIQESIAEEKRIKDLANSANHG